MDKIYIMITQCNSPLTVSSCRGNEANQIDLNSQALSTHSFGMKGMKSPVTWGDLVNSIVINNFIAVFDCLIKKSRSKATKTNRLNVMINIMLPISLAK